MIYVIIDKKVKYNKTFHLLERVGLHRSILSHTHTHTHTETLFITILLFCLNSLKLLQNTRFLLLLTHYFLLLIYC